MSEKTFEEKLKHYRLTQDEYKRIESILGRAPRGVEWALFSALWSEHCSYKSSKIHLKKFAATMNSKVVTSEGENAGIVDLGQGEQIVFKMESHNHPSFIEPYQGAATGVGGILRDIFTMGARPIALADYLCFGEPSAPRMKSLIQGVVKGISGYGNSVGVPTITGQTNFDPSYNQNILVNAMAVGLIQKGEPITLSGAKGVGNWVIYVGAKTGRDGVHGAAMASESFDENSESKRPNVQIGDPFYEKLLIESCLEVFKKGWVVSIQDMGAAGLTSSSFEMSAKGQLGMRMHLDLVPLRDPTMQPEEILLSESQERMLLICEPTNFEALKSIFQNWGLDAVRIGEVVANPEVSLFWKGEELTSLDPKLLVDNAPQYQRPYENWNHPNRVPSLEARAVSFTEQLKKYLGSSQGCDRDFIFNQYDQRVGGMTARGADHDVAVQRLPLSGRGLCMAVGCRPEWMQRDAELGGFDSVFYPSLQMLIKGGVPLAATDCLNFASPENPKIMSEFVAAVEAIRDACITLDVPVVSGNVSFYNETKGNPITSTPAVGIVGLRTGVEKIPEDQFTRVGNEVLLVECDIVQSAMGEKTWMGEFDPKRVRDFGRTLKVLVDKGLVESSQMVGRGGILASVAKMCTKQQPLKSKVQSLLGLRFDASIDASDFSTETLYQVILEVKDAAAVQAELGDIEVRKLGEVISDNLEFKAEKIKVSELNSLAQDGARRIFETMG